RAALAGRLLLALCREQSVGSIRQLVERLEETPERCLPWPRGLGRPGLPTGQDALDARADEIMERGAPRARADAFHRHNLNLGRSLRPWRTPVETIEIEESTPGLAARLVRRQLDDIAEALESAAEGDPGVRLRTDGPGPLARIAAAANRLLGRDARFAGE